MDMLLELYISKGQGGEGTSERSALARGERMTKKHLIPLLSIIIIIIILLYIFN